MSYLALVESYIEKQDVRMMNNTLSFINGLESYSAYDENDIYDIKDLIKKYMELCYWFSVNKDNKVLKDEEIVLVIKEIETLEDVMVARGIQSEVLDHIIKITTEQANKKLDELNGGQQLKMISAIFGEVKEVLPLSKA